MALSKERQGEIAYAVIKSRLRTKGATNFKPNDMLREIENSRRMDDLKELGISKEEAIQFIKTLYEEVFTEFLAGLDKKED